ncbi:hypothetical protein NPIL_159831 [Nephila pilipes]|uniref:Uncharacterized protein n=1 Tax=Nephila pilipes TaxID=299642 RepID=A0A8X6U9V1_NEPPI|nr:hypothetical protein NPIL_159831 [Nephila pilipes]
MFVFLHLAIRRFLSKDKKQLRLFRTVFCLSSDDTFLALKQSPDARFPAQKIHVVEFYSDVAIIVEAEGVLENSPRFLKPKCLAFPGLGV